MNNPPRLLTLGGTLAAAMVFLAAGCTKPVEMAGAVPATSTLGTDIDDSVITAAVKASLLRDPEIRSLDLQVETRKGEVQLSGFVDSQDQMDRAVAAAQATASVMRVQSSMGLKGASRAMGVKVDDGILTAGVKAALLGDEKVKSSDIAVVTRKGEVQLSGFVDSQSQIDRAVIITRTIQGVERVSNAMSIKK